MRLDAVTFRKLGFKEVCLNGQKLFNCYEADDVEGWAKVYKEDKDGHFLTMDNGDGTRGLIKETLYGKVEFLKLY